MYFMCCYVNKFVCLVYCVFDSVCELFDETLLCWGVVAILLMNIMDVFSVVGGALLDRPCMIFQIMCVFCL